MKREIFYPLFFMAALAATPTTSQATDYFLMYELGFNSREIGYLSVVTYLAMLIGTAIFVYISSKDSFSMRLFFFWATVAAALLPLLFLIVVFRLNTRIGIPNIVFVIGDTLVVNVAIDMVLMASLVLSARLCPPGVEAVLFATFMAVRNAGVILSAELGARLTDWFNIECSNMDSDSWKDAQCDFSNLWLLIIVCNATTILPLLMIRCVPNESQLKEITDRLNTQFAPKSHKSKRDRNTDPYLKSCKQLRNGISAVDDSELIGAYLWIRDYICNPLIRLCCNHSQNVIIFEDDTSQSHSDNNDNSSDNYANSHNRKVTKVDRLLNEVDYIIGSTDENPSNDTVSASLIS